MNVISVLFGGALQKEAFIELTGSKSAFLLSLERAASFDGVNKVALLAGADFDAANFCGADFKNIEVIKKPIWNVKILLDALCEAAEGFDLIYYAWADTPLLDAELAGAIKNRFTKFAAEYAYADGFPLGLAPELLLPSTAVFLAKLAAGSEAPVQRDTIFSVLQKDINAFDIETELATVDLRAHRLLFAADSRRNLLLLRRVLESGWQDYRSAEKIIYERPEILRTLPAYFPIMVSANCPQKCKFCPYNGISTILHSPLPQFIKLIDSIIEFAGDGVISLSLWGEISLHPQRRELIAAVLARRELSLIIETCGVGWTAGDTEAIAALAAEAAPRVNGMAALSWIVSLDAASPERYNELHSGGATQNNFEEAVNFTRSLIAVFGKNVYAQAINVRGAEDDIEAFYRFWKEAGAEVIIQKYDDFCGRLPDEQAGDISPLNRHPCWHLMRDFPILIDGSVPVCREASLIADGALHGGETPAGVPEGEEGFAALNIAEYSLNEIWERRAALYERHCQAAAKRQDWHKICKNCDEYYTFNF